MPKGKSGRKAPAWFHQYLISSNVWKLSDWKQIEEHLDNTWDVEKCLVILTTLWLGEKQIFLNKILKISTTKKWCQTKRNYTYKEKTDIKYFVDFFTWPEISYYYIFSVWTLVNQYALISTLWKTWFKMLHMTWSLKYSFL